MAGVEEAASSGSHLNGDLDPDDREEGAASTAEEAAKKKRRKKKKSKGAATGKGSCMFPGSPPGMAGWLGSGPAEVTGSRDLEPGTGLLPRTERMSSPGYRVPVPGRGCFSCGTRERVRVGWGRGAQLLLR